MANDDRGQLVERLREARRLSGLSQARVADFMNWHRPTVSQIEAGERKVGVDELRRLAELYDVSLSWLIGSADESGGLDASRVQLAARELQKLKPQDLDRLLQVLAAMRREGED